MEPRAVLPTNVISIPSAVFRDHPWDAVAGKSSSRLKGITREYLAQGPEERTWLGVFGVYRFSGCRESPRAAYINTNLDLNHQVMSGSRKELAAKLYELWSEY